VYYTQFVVLSIKYKIMIEKSLNQIENIFWEKPPQNASSLVQRCIELRNKKLSEFSLSDLRLMIGQSISLEYLIPIAIDILKENILVECDYYEGDLLLSVMGVNNVFIKYWQVNPNILQELILIIESNKVKIAIQDEEFMVKFRNSFDKLLQAI